MDLFKYKVCIKELEMCSRVGEMEYFVRKYAELCPRFSWELKVDSIYYYKLYTYSLNRFKTLSKRILPDFIYDRKETAQINILASMLEANREDNKKHYGTNTQIFTKTPTYEEFMDYFEFDNNLILHRSDWYVEKLNEIIGDKPVHFKVKFNYSNSSFDSYSTNLLESQKTLLYAIRYKQVNFPDKPQTIWDMFIEDSKQEVLKHDLSELSTIDQQILKLQQHIKALESLEGYIHG